MQIRSNSYDPSQRPFPQADITRTNREAIDRGTPEPDSAKDVRARLARHKHEAAEKADRAQAARQRHEDAEKAQRATAARQKHEAAEKSNRARLARERDQGQGDRVDLETGGASRNEQARSLQESLIAQRASAARQKHEAAEVSQRAQAARDKLSLSDTTLRLRSAVAPDDAARSERLAELRGLHQAGALNTDELIARAAFKLLSGE